MNLRSILKSFAARQWPSGRRFALPGAFASRVEVCPPAGTRYGWKARLRRWLDSGWASTSPHAHWHGAESPRRTKILLAVRREFIDALTDVRTERVCMLLERIRAARSLRELWHLRPDVFDLVARFHAQAEADRRLALLNRHFPTRAPRSGFGPLGGEVDR